MTSVRPQLLRNLGLVAPTFALMVTATVGALVAETSATSVSPVLAGGMQTVSYANGSPLGKVERYTMVKGGLHVQGWTFDPSSTKRSIRAYSKVSGHRSNSVIATKKRLDVKHKYSLASSKHGFDFVIPVPEGRHTVCVYADDFGRGKDSRIGCKHDATYYYGPYTAPAPQTTPAPISTSRYLRNIRGACDTESATLASAGRYDALHNPAGHRYLQLLDIGGQSQSRNGVLLSATTRFVTYPNLLTCMKSYVQGYAGGMHTKAPATIAIGVNNDIDVSSTTGRAWATQVINPLASYASGFPNVKIAGANDIEPGFSGSYASTNSWVAGYLSATKAPFIFNGSADGCSWTTTNRSCNNGWSMAKLYQVAGGASPSRMMGLPQVYNYTMADQWKYISLTGVGMRKSRINFGGPLTEYTACAQARSCNSIGGVAAWNRMWRNLQSDPRLRVSSLPYATDLRIDS